MARANSVPAIATSAGTPADAKNATIIASYTPAPPGVAAKTAAIEDNPQAMNSVAGFTKKPSAKNAIRINNTSNKLASIAHRKGRINIFLSRLIFI